jgi:hypothetical protein
MRRSRASFDRGGDDAVRCAARTTGRLARMTSQLAHSLREQPTSWLAFAPRRFLLLGGPLGGREVYFGANGALYAYSPLNDWQVQAALDKALAAGATPEPVPAETLAVLAEGERAYLALRARLATGALGWRIHTELLVIEVAGGLYNTAFAGDAATGYTKFAESGERTLRAEQLKRATLGTAASAVHDVSPSRYQSLVALIAKQDATPAVLLAALARGELELVGGGPTSDQYWTLYFAAGRFAQRFADETAECSPEQVRGILERRGYHTVRWRV